MAVGDCAGGVTLYNEHSRITQFIPTSAWRREQDRPLRSKKFVSWPNSITNIAWWKDQLVVITAQELELYEIGESTTVRVSLPLHPGPSTMWCVPHLDLWRGRILWTTGGRRLAEIDSDTPSRKNGNRIRNDTGEEMVDEVEHLVEENEGEIPKLVETGLESVTETSFQNESDCHSADGEAPSSNKSDNDQGKANISSIDEESMGKTEVACPRESTLVRITYDSVGEKSCVVQPIAPLDHFQCLTAIWDYYYIEKSSAAFDDDPVFVAVAWTSPGQIDLIRCHACSLQVTHRFENCLPNTNKADVFLQQSDNGKHTFLLGGKGIRLLDTATLNTLQIFGESVSLHGKIVQWRSCQWVRAPRLGKHDIIRRNRKKQCWIERSDSMLASSVDLDNDDQEDETDIDRYWLVGLPHPSKGPDELKSTIYVWKPSQGAPVATLNAPPGGCLGLMVRNSCDGWRMTCATVSGELWEWKSVLQSNFAGAMYPINYRIVEDNIEYIEDEDELDQRVQMESDDEDDGKAVPVPEADYSLAVKLSLQMDIQTRDRQTLRVYDVARHEKYIVPCRPDSLIAQSKRENYSACQVMSPDYSPTKKDGFENECLATLPQTRLVRKRYKILLKQREAIIAQGKDLLNVEKPQLALPPRLKGKRTKTANVETILQASVNPELRHLMGMKQTMWADGRGSSLRDIDMRCSSSSLCLDTPYLKDVESAENSVPNMPQKTEGMEFTTEFESAESSVNDVTRTTEEKEIAMELLLLSPSKRRINTSSDATKEYQRDVNHGSNVKGTEQDEFCDLPDEKKGDISDAEENSINIESKHHPRKVLTCAACMGRLVFHSCGKKEKPVDYEAIERAERERREREEEERQRVRVEKRRAADARRREARKKKKEEEEMIRREEERKRREEVERMLTVEKYQSGLEDIRGNEIEKTSIEPSFRPLTSGYTCLVSDGASSEVHIINDQYCDSTNVDANAHLPQSTLMKEHSLPEPSKLLTHSRNEPLRIGDTEVQPSMSLSASDALAALAGLADSMPAASSTVNGSRDAFPPAPASWFSHHEEEVEEASGVLCYAETLQSMPYECTEIAGDSNRQDCDHGMHRTGIDDGTVCLDEYLCNQNTVLIRGERIETSFDDDKKAAHSYEFSSIIPQNAQPCLDVSTTPDDPEYPTSYENVVDHDPNQSAVYDNTSKAFLCTKARKSVGMLLRKLVSEA